jgi:hypothetical protein
MSLFSRHPAQKNVPLAGDQILRYTTGSRGKGGTVDAETNYRPLGGHLASRSFLGAEFQKMLDISRKCCSCIVLPHARMARIRVSNRYETGYLRCGWVINERSNSMRFHAIYAAVRDEIDLYGRTSSNVPALPIKFSSVPTPIGGEAEPLIKLTRQEATELMGALWEAGVRCPQEPTRIDSKQNESRIREIRNDLIEVVKIILSHIPDES